MDTHQLDKLWRISLNKMELCRFAILADGKSWGNIYIDKNEKSK